MRKSVYLLAVLALLAAAGCSRTEGITAPERSTPSRVNDGGTPTSTTTTSTQPDTVAKGGGFLGSGG